MGPVKSKAPACTWIVQFPCTGNSIPRKGARPGFTKNICVRCNPCRSALSRPRSSICTERGSFGPRVGGSWDLGAGHMDTVSAPDRASRSAILSAKIRETVLHPVQLSAKTFRLTVRDASSFQRSQRHSRLDGYAAPSALVQLFVTEPPKKWRCSVCEESPTVPPFMLGSRLRLVVTSTLDAVSVERRRKPEFQTNRRATSRPIRH